MDRRLKKRPTGENEGIIYDNFSVVGLKAVVLKVGSVELGSTLNVRPVLAGCLTSGFQSFYLCDAYIFCI